MKTVCDSSQRSTTPLRIVVLCLSGLATIGMLAIVAVVVASGQLSSGETMARELGWIILLAYGGPYVVFILPALVLGMLDRWLKVALALCVLSVPALVIVLRHA